MKLTGGGEYTQITVKIADDVADEDCEELLDNLKVGTNIINKEVIVSLLSPTNNTVITQAIQGQVRINTQYRQQIWRES